MRQARRQLSIRPMALAGALAAGALVSGAGCHHRARPQTAAQRAASQLDSIQTAAGRRRLSSGMQAVDFTDSDRNRFTRVELMIQARFSGVRVTQRGSAYSIRIRGAESFNASTEPLVIVDGATLTTADLGAVNPRDVVRIEVLKDAAASLYGVRGGNGVIVIMTQRVP